MNPRTAAASAKCERRGPLPARALGAHSPQRIPDRVRRRSEFPPGNFTNQRLASIWNMEMTEKLIIHKCESLTFRDKKLSLNSRTDKRYFANGIRNLKNPRIFSP